MRPPFAKGGDIAIIGLAKYGLPGFNEAALREGRRSKDEIRTDIEQWCFNEAALREGRRCGRLRRIRSNRDRFNEAALREGRR